MRRLARPSPGIRYGLSSSPPGPCGTTSHCRTPSTYPWRGGWRLRLSRRMREARSHSRPSKASWSSAVRGASKSSEIRSLPSHPPGRRGSVVWRKGTSLAIGLPALARMISSPYATHQLNRFDLELHKPPGRPIYPVSISRWRFSSLILSKSPWRGEGPFGKASAWWARSRAASSRPWEAVVDHYVQVFGLVLTDQEKADLVQFLKSL